MANGVPETEVFKAADAVLARGERPTVERVRIELGRGSPARVGQLLEQWWEQLAHRLKGRALLPELPGEVAQVFAETWRLAFAHADTSAQAALTEEQNRLFALHTSLTQERKVWEIALAEAEASAAESTAQRSQSEAQLLERQVMIEQLLDQIADLKRQRDHLQIQLDHRQSEVDTLRREHAIAQSHIRAAEDRAHQQVDQLRQDLKALRLQREKDLRDRDKQVAQLTGREQDLLQLLRTSEQAAAHRAGRIETLETTIARWQRERTTATRTASKTPKKGAAKKSSSRHTLQKK